MHGGQATGGGAGGGGSHAKDPLEVSKIRCLITNSRFGLGVKCQNNPSGKQCVPSILPEGC